MHISYSRILGFPGFWVEAGGVPHRGELELTGFTNFQVVKYIAIP